MKKRQHVAYRILFATILFTSLSANLLAQKPAITRVEPLNWWVGMANPNLQILVNGPSISTTNVSITYPGVELKKVTKVQSSNYLFLDLTISPQTQPGEMSIVFTDAKKNVLTYRYQLKARDAQSAMRQGFNSSDAIYLIMPDRFANGDPSNDSNSALVEQGNRQAPYGRHGGDIQGIINNIDYLSKLGMTAIWLTPALENNQKESSYHGYAITDYYHIDAREGSNEKYKEMVDKCREKGIKVIMDMVFNHCGSGHWWMQDLPMNDWINQFPQFTRSNYRLSTVADPHASKADVKGTTQGWFDMSMPDLNLRNDFMLNYMIQNSIWWVEYAGLQGIRQDTYPYPDKEGMRKWNERIAQEYPNFNIVGECWISSPSKLCYWQKDFNNNDGYNSELPSLMDFPLMEALRRALNETGSWDNGIVRLYDILADDHLYPNPFNMVAFPENHDTDRLMATFKDDIRKFKMAMAFIATTRGIAQVYYGTEILMNGSGKQGDAFKREDFPGGWPGDAVNCFTAEGRTQTQNEAWNYMSKVFNYRKTSEVIHKGQLIHFIPENEVYVYFRVLNNKAVMVLMNNNDNDSKTINTERFAEVMTSFTKGQNIENGQVLSSLKEIEVPAKSAMIIELTK